MKIKFMMSLAMAASLIFVQPAARAQSSPEEDQGPDRILKMLTERERRFVEGKDAPTDLTQEERQHIDRIMRLHKIETEREAEYAAVEPAGAEAAQPRTHQVEVQMDNDLGHMQSEANLNVLMREIATLRAEVMRLNARLNALEQGGAGISEPIEDETPSFYLPIR